MLGALIDEWVRARPTLRGLAQPSVRYEAWLAARLFERAASAGLARVLSIGAAPAHGVFTLLAAHANAQSNALAKGGGAAEAPLGALEAVCVDVDRAACDFVSARANAYGLASRVQVVQENVMRLGRQAGRLAPWSFDAVVVPRAAAELDDDDLFALLSWCRRRLRPTGMLVVSLPSVHAPDRSFLDEIVDWPLHARSEDEVRELFAESDLGDGVVHVEADASNAWWWAAASRS